MTGKLKSDSADVLLVCTCNLTSPAQSQTLSKVYAFTSVASQLFQGCEALSWLHNDDQACLRFDAIGPAKSVGLTFPFSARTSPLLSTAIKRSQK